MPPRRRDDADRLCQTAPGRRRPYRMLSADGCPKVCSEEMWSYRSPTSGAISSKPVWARLYPGALRVADNTDVGLRHPGSTRVPKRSQLISPATLYYCDCELPSMQAE